MLVVDDDQVVADQVSFILNDIGVHTMVVDSGDFLEVVMRRRKE